ncbi:type VI secretion system protein ImpH [Cricetibacter osteomyelitidis]|uniref:Type VI secretion system protein ImpH n=1 Tax=Cricetibacter osteomyelitidis TaxID=1521931 RepID=A0A4R2T8E6_9PAST|nr:type VI secretion system baseplate subunit TssG [Cricetibacter osteomyelitidis]TCP91172.1 type VI secretion system protein ImpH [Cricetibacter osteomyelitidis]
MGLENDLAADNLIDFSFYQLIEIFAKKYNFDLEDFDKCSMDDSLFCFESNPLIHFPTSDIEKISIKTEKLSPKVEMIVNFLGLQGANGPLPGTLLSEIAYESYNQDTIRKTYLDFFNHHLIALLYSIWRKYKYYIRFQSDLSDNFSQRILSLIGVNRHHLNTIDINWGKLLFYVGVIQSNVRTADVLAKIIRHYFDLTDISINEYERQLVGIDKEQQNRLGTRNMVLGDSFVIGKVITSFTNKFRININGLDTECFHQFLPSGKKFTELKEIMKFLLKDQLPYDLCLGLQPQVQSNFVLGSNESGFLGWSTLLNANSEQQVKMKQVIITGQA